MIFDIETLDSKAPWGLDQSNLRTLGAVGNTRCPALATDDMIVEI